MRMTNGDFATCEGNNLATGKTSSWFGEYYRLKCEGGAAMLFTAIRASETSMTVDVQEVVRQVSGLA
jgi:hypothetical protein